MNLTLIAGGVLALLCTGWWLDRSSLQDRLDTCAEARGGLQAQVDNQNTHIRQAEQAASAAQAQAREAQQAVDERDAALAAAGKDAASWRARALASRSTDCASAIDLIRRGGK